MGALSEAEAARASIAKRYAIPSESRPESTIRWAILLATPSRILRPSPWTSRCICHFPLGVALASPAWPSAQTSPIMSTFTVPRRLLTTLQKGFRRSSVKLAWTVRRNSYFDSIDLMRVAEQARQLAGVTEVAVVMGTPPGRSMLTEAGMWPAEAPEAGPSDLLISVRASTDTVANLALACVEELLSASRGTESARVDMPPRTTISAARGSRATNVALIAVPGAYAAIDAHQALSAGLHVFLFSDGVSVDDEVALKRRAGARGLLMMGPECGTSIINGVGLGFANRVRRGPIGVIGASGTGLQEVTSLIHRFGAGVSHAIGTGGRDLHAAVGGLTTLQAVGALAADVDTRVLLIVSKPPSPAVADAVLRAAVATRKPVVACLLGYEGATPTGVRTATTLEEAATTAVGRL